MPYTCTGELLYCTCINNYYQFFFLFFCRKKRKIFTRSITEDPQLDNTYTRYEDTRRLIVDKQAHEEQVISNPLADHDDDNDVDHEQIELRSTLAVESEPAGDLHAYKTQTSSADLEPANPTDSRSSSETHVYTHENTIAMRSWDSDTEHDVDGEKIELIQKPQSAVGSSHHASTASMLSDSAHGGTQPQDGEADHEEMELMEIALI